MVIFDDGSFIIFPLLYLFIHCSLLFIGSDDPTPSNNIRRRFRKDIDKEKTQDSVGNFVVEGRRGNSPIEEMGKLGGLL